VRDFFRRKPLDVVAHLPRAASNCVAFSSNQMHAMNVASTLSPTTTVLLQRNYWTKIKGFRDLEVKVLDATKLEIDASELRRAVQRDDGQMLPAGAMLDAQLDHDAGPSSTEKPPHGRTLTARGGVARALLDEGLVRGEGGPKNHWCPSLVMLPLTGQLHRRIGPTHFSPHHIGVVARSARSSR